MSPIRVAFSAKKQSSPICGTVSRQGTIKAMLLKFGAPQRSEKFGFFRQWFHLVVITLITSNLWYRVCRTKNLHPNIPDWDGGDAM
jgi:hypothetical protein